VLHADTAAELTVLVPFADDRLLIPPPNTFSKTPVMVDKPAALRLKTVQGIFPATFVIATWLIAKI